jgi:hypothetical protein
MWLAHQYGFCGGATRRSKGSRGFRGDRTAKSCVTQCSMRVQIPPSRCRSDSISPRPATGPQRLEAGRNGGPWQPHAGYPVSQASMGSASKGVVSHREGQPAQEAEALEPKRHRIRRRQPSILTGLHCHRNPVERTALRMQLWELGTE